MGDCSDLKAGNPGTSGSCPTGGGGSPPAPPYCPDPGAGWNGGGSVGGGSVGGGSIGSCTVDRTDWDHEWWINNIGDNTLKGVEGDDCNPPRLEAAMIYDILREIPEARDSYNRLYPRMLPEEQARLDEITQGIVTYVVDDPKFIEDNFQASQNTVGIQTKGPKGGIGGIGGGANGRAGARPPPRGGST